MNGTKIFRKPAHEHEELEAIVNNFLSTVSGAEVSYQASGGYLFAFITYRAKL